MKQPLPPHPSFDTAEAEFLYYPIAVATSVLCLLIFRVLSPYLSAKLWPNYRHLPERVRVDWGTRVVSTVHATTVSLLSAYSHLFDDGIHTHLTWWDCPLVRATCAFVVGYMVMDLLLITFYFKYLGELEYYVHHLVSISAYYYIMTYPVVPFFANFRLLSEISTPFLNIRWFLLTMGAGKTGGRYVVNGVVLVLSFLLCRVLAIPAYWHKVHLASHLDHFGSLGYIPVILVLTCVVLDSLNLYWFYKLLRSYGKGGAGLADLAQDRAEQLLGGEAGNQPGQVWMSEERGQFAEEKQK